MQEVPLLSNVITQLVGAPEDAPSTALNFALPAQVFATLQDLDAGMRGCRLPLRVGGELMHQLARCAQLSHHGARCQFYDAAPGMHCWSS